MNCLIDTKTPVGEVNYMMARLYPGHELPQFQEIATKKWEQMDPEYSLEGLMLKLKLQYFSHLMQRTDSLIGKNPDAGKD